MEAAVSDKKVAMLVSMGFGDRLARRALLLESGNVERAADMLLTSPPPLEEDVVIDVSGDQASRDWEKHGSRSSDGSPSLDELLGMGFNIFAARSALQEADGDMQVAVQRLLEPSAEGTQTAPKRRRRNGPKRHAEEIRDSSSGIVPNGSSSSSGAVVGSMTEQGTGEAPANAKDKSKDTKAQKAHTVDYLSRNVAFGPSAFGPLRSVAAMALKQDGQKCKGVNVKKIVEASVPGVKRMHGERGAKCVTQMLADCYEQGLFMHGPPSSPVNQEIIPAMHHIFNVFNQASPKDARRVSYLTALANACLDCQQVQAREIMRTFGDLTSQNDTFEGQLRYSLVRQKEAALNAYISRMHARCDRDHREVNPWQQRPHLFSGYVALIGEDFGFDGVAAAQSDRFLPQVKTEIGRVKSHHLKKELLKDMSPKEWLQTLLADINNQTPGSDRLIDRDCIFKWAQANMSQESAHLVFYDDERSAEFEDLEPKTPAAENEYQPFLSPKVLVDMLLQAGMLENSA